MKPQALETNPDLLEAIGSASFTGLADSMGEILRDVRTWFSRYMFVLDPRDLDVLALWTVHTWLCKETYTSPRLLIDSPVPGSGKTTLLEHLAKLCKNPMQMAAVSSAAMLVRLTQDNITTILIDEADRALDPKKKDVGELLAVLNSGYKVGSTRPVLVAVKSDWVPVEMSTFSPVAISGNTPLLPDDTRSRCIVIRLLPDLYEQVEESDWELLDGPAKELSDRIELVTNEIRDQVRQCRPDVPKGCVNRLKERWYPLKRIAYLAGEQWSQLVDELIVEDIANEKERLANGDAHISVNLQLATDLYQIYSPEFGFIQTTTLVSQLIRENPESWSTRSYYGKELTMQWLGRRLNSAYGLTSSRIAEGRGYHANQFKAMWRQLGVSLPEADKPVKLDGLKFPTTEESQLL